MDRTVSVNDMAMIIGFKEIELFALRRELAATKGDADGDTKNPEAPKQVSEK